MGRLYWKIFLGFWLTTVIIVAATSWSVSLLEDEPDIERPPRPRGHWRLANEATTAQILLNSGGELALAEWLRLRDRGRYRPWVIDATGQDILGRRLPPLLEQALQRNGDVPLRELTDPTGAVYRLWLAPRVRSLAPPNPQLFIVRLAVAIFVSGLVCWLLARYLTRPLGVLKTATHRLAAGDLGVRVGDAIAGRRDEIADLGADFDRMATRLESLLAAQRRLLRDVSHELRSPLARMQVALELARRRGRGAEAELERIAREAQRLEDMVGQLLSLMRLESGAELASTASVDMAELLDSVARDAAFEAENRSRRVIVTERAPAAIQGDSELLRSALENLVRNAVRHTQENTAVGLSLSLTAGDVIITIRDHGPGVPEADLPRLFDPFFRVEDARDRGSGGYGLGLAIAARAVRLHGGDIEARNVAGGGLSVLIRLPLVSRADINQRTQSSNT